MIFLQLFWEFLKIGMFTFGGAYGAIPLIRDAVLSNAWLSEEQFSYFLGVSESTPGPIMVNMATYVGFTKGSEFGFFAGVLGSALCTLGVVLPALVIMILISSLLRRYLANPHVKAVLASIAPAVTGIIAVTGAFMLLENIFTAFPQGFGGFDLSALLIALILTAVLCLYAGLRKKAMSAILFIFIAAGLGILFYGL